MVTKEMGRGLYADKLIRNDEVIMQCELLVLSESDTKVINKTELQHYTFAYDKQRDCLVLGLGEIFNHADEPNTTFKLVWLGDRHIMEFRANKAIESGAQLMINYNSDVNVNIENYVKQKSLVG